jgi:glycosyltransferase involved in cell wall biosynthesis
MIDSVLGPIVKNQTQSCPVLKQESETLTVSRVRGQMIRVGIECESVEGEHWGVGRILSKILEEISHRKELSKEFRFYLFFRSRIPPLSFLDNPIFVKRIVPLPSLFKVLGVKSPPPFSIYYFLLLPLMLMRERLDASYFPNYMLPVLCFGKSVVDLTEDVYYEARFGKHPFCWRLGFRVFCWWAAKKGTRIEAFSQASKEAVSKLYNICSQRITVNYHGLDVALDMQGRERMDGIDEPYILYFGQAFPRRHLRETMLAFERIADRFPGLRLIAVGYDRYSPPIVKGLQRLINNRLGREAIVHEDYVTEAERHQLFSRALAVIYVSNKEAFGLPPLEALSYGTVAIVARTGTTEELLGDKAFFVSEPDSIESIAGGIVEALTDHEKRAQILKHGADFVKRFTWQAHTNRFLEVLREVCGKQTPPTPLNGLRSFR